MVRDPETGVWSVTHTGDGEGRYYRYAVEVFVRGVGLVRNLVTDPYSISLDADSQHSYIADLGAPALKPEGWDRHQAPRSAASQEDMTIYELHVRDFSISDPTVPADHRGKYLAFTDADSAGMQHLQELATAGLTDIHLLPVFDLASIPELGCVTPVIPDAARRLPRPSRRRWPPSAIRTASTGATTRSTTRRPRAATPPTRPTAPSASASCARW